uniref:Uncharacterized protein n=1 Tax=Glossina austeni TaxID=7395 RepID=A0A1A9UN63_GLOAU
MTIFLGAIFPVSNAKQALISEHTPAPASEWPKFDLMEPINRANCNVTNGCKHKFAPPTIAASISPLRKAVKALSKAYIELEQAVSTKNEGPSKPKQYEMRFANIARLQPVTPKPPDETLSAVFPEFRPDNAKRNGVIALISSTGAVASFNEMTDEPVAMDCTN